MRQRRVLLAAMSGVRARRPELLEAGLTLPGFMERSRVIASLPSLGLLGLAGLCPPHWEPFYREYDELAPDAADRVAAEGYDLVALSSLSARILETYAFADALRARGLRVVLGGLHVSALPDEAGAHADAVVAGEGEGAWPEVLADAERGRLKPVYRSARGPAWGPGDPLPRYDLLDVSRYNRLTLQTARGCPLHCSFCAASRAISPYRLKPLSRVRRELEAILELWPRPFIELADDNTFVRKPWSRDLARLLGEYRTRWFTETDISAADDPELVDLLAESGCAQVLIGLESPAPEGLRGLDSRDWKRRQADRYMEKIRRIQAAGVSVNGCFILGLDSQGPEAFAEVERFVSESGLAEAQITLLTPFPGTALHASLQAEGRLFPGPFWDRLTLFDVVYRPKRMSVSELEAGFLGLMRRLYSKDSAGRRRREFGLRRRAARRDRGRRPAFA